MKLIDIKRESEVKLTGVRADIEWHGHSIHGVTLRDESGRIVRFTSHYGLSVLVEAPPVTFERYRLYGRVPGVEAAVDELHETEPEAKARLREIEDALRGDVELKIEKVACTEDQWDAYVAAREARGEKPAVLDESPF